MQAEAHHAVESIKYAISLLRQHVNWDEAVARYAELESQITQADFWNDQDNAQAVMKEKNRLETQIQDVELLETGLSDQLEMIALAEEEGDTDMVAEAEAALQDLAVIAGKKQLASLLSGEADGNNCYIEIHPGAGGTEAQDWASMLQRMYMRWAERRGFKLEVIEETAGDEAGIKSATIKVNGDTAYGWSKTESGVHRLVRISPYDSSARRHTSFASVWVYPEVDDNIDIEVEEKDLRVDTYRASGAGGQHVNTTDSAIRITHVPTNIVVQCQSDRSQHRNRATAMSMLKARLYELELQRREEAAMDTNALRQKLAGVIRSALMCCIPIRWSKICGPVLKKAMLRVCLMAIWMILLKPALPHASAPKPNAFQLLFSGAFHLPAADRKPLKSGQHFAHQY